MVVFIAVFLLILLKLLQGAVNWLSEWRMSIRLKSTIKEQGISGPTPRFFAGNLLEMDQLRTATRENGMEGISHDIVPHVTPERHLWTSHYGKPYLYWWIGEPRVVLFDPELCRSILSSRSDSFPKSSVQLEFVDKLLGDGLVSVNGEEWSHHRKALLPAFHILKLKGMLATFQECAQRLVDDWSQRVAHGEAEIEIFEDLTRFAADSISRTAFSSDYKKGERVFELLNLSVTRLFKLYYQWSWLPGFRHLPIPLNIEIWKLQREMDNILLSLVRERRRVLKTSTHKAGGVNLLDLILLEGDVEGKTFSDKKLVGECKTFYLAGHETTASLITWTLFLLAVNPLWQERARDEVKEHCRDEFEYGEVLGRLKLVGMILNETLRLYPPAIELHRIADKDIVLNGLKVPKGMGVTIPILSLHHDKELWGENVNEFDPERFAPNGAGNTHGFMPFGAGPRICIGQLFALMEAKIALAALLRRFSFKLAPGYKHNPVPKLLLVPEHGIQLLVERISSK